MKTLINWLAGNKIIASLLAIALYFCIVTFHDEVTDLAIWVRNTIGRDKYNEYLLWIFIFTLVIILAYLSFHLYRSPRRMIQFTYLGLITGLIVFAFNVLMVYNIEAIHFIEYMLLVIVMLPVLKSYGETVFWVTILGILDELFQYRFLTPEFEYFDFNDCILNLAGAGAGAIFVHITTGLSFEPLNKKWFRYPAILTGTILILAFIVLMVTGKMTINPAGQDAGNWFSLNRLAMNGELWTEAYEGRYFHILKPREGITTMYIIFAAFFLLDYLTVRAIKKTGRG